METTPAGTAFELYTGPQLLQLLRTENDRLPRTVVNEFVRRGEGMVPALRDIVARRRWWEQEGAGFWEPIHATFILGAIGGEAALPGLLEALHWSALCEVDWVTNALPNILGAQGRASLGSLKIRARDVDLPGEEGVLALYGLVSVAARHPIHQGEILDFFRVVVEDDEEDDGIRDVAAHGLLSFARPGDRDLLISWAKHAVDAFEKPIFDKHDVRNVYKGRPIDLAPYRRDWLEFYRPEEIGERQKRWKTEEADPLEPRTKLPYITLEGGDLVIDAGKVPPLEELIREEFRPVKVRHHEDDFAYLLMAIEEPLLHAFRRSRALTNDDARRAVKEVLDRLPKPPPGELALEIHERLRRTAALQPRKISDMEIIGCLHRVLDSIKHHGGARSYLQFLDGMMP
ncbi:MAG: hypothetical protein HY293_09460 [Planctomycetes bacterium]|nr:hypothetical protein [Planctomycetota bacterium]